MNCHPCPGCAAMVPTNPHYPKAFCAACVANAATDSAGTPLDSVKDPHMALAYRLAGSSTWQPAASILCRIRGPKAVVNQARFGGLVAKPLATPSPQHRGTVTL